MYKFVWSSLRYLFDISQWFGTYGVWETNVILLHYIYCFPYIWFAYGYRIASLLVEIIRMYTAQ